MTRSLECPRCHCRDEGEPDPRRGFRCPECGAPMLLAAVPAESLVRRYLHGSRLQPLRPERPAAH